MHIVEKILIVTLLLITVCGCGSKKDNKKINVDIGSKDVTYNKVVNCGDKTATSSLFFGKDKTFKYSFYECSGTDLHLISGEGTYNLKDQKITLLDNYGQKFDVDYDDKSVKLNYNSNLLTLTK